MAAMDDYTDEVAEDMNYILAANPITKERLRYIPNTYTYANSVNVYVGRPRSGKTYLALHDIISVIRNDETAHLLVYINESGQCDDDTFNRLQQLIDIPIMFVKYADAEKYLRNINQYKNIYNRIKDENIDVRHIPTDVINDLYHNLHINDLCLPYLHTLILLEDATNSKAIRRADSYINDLLTRCAHTQFSFFILIHYWKALTTNIKANLSTIYIFGGYSRQQLAYMLYQMNIPIELKTLMREYSKIKQYGKLMIDCISTNYAFIA